MYKFKSVPFILLLLVIGISSCSKRYYVGQVQSTLLKVAEVQPDSATLAFYNPYKLSLDSQMSRVIGHSAEELQKGLPESKLGNFFADAVGATCIQQGIVYDIMFPTSNGGIRSSLPEGKITLGNVFELMPFENELVLLELNASQIRMLAQFIVDKGGQPIGGMRITAVEKKITDLSIGGEEIIESKKYKVVTSDYLSGGGDGIEAFKGVERINLNLKVRDAIRMYIEEEAKQGRILNPQIDGRINIIK